MEKVNPFQSVTFPVRDPPPARPNPAMTWVDEGTAELTVCWVAVAMAKVTVPMPVVGFICNPVPAAVDET